MQSPALLPDDLRELCSWSGRAQAWAQQVCMEAQFKRTRASSCRIENPEHECKRVSGKRVSSKIRGYQAWDQLVAVFPVCQWPSEIWYDTNSAGCWQMRDNFRRAQFNCIRTKGRPTPRLSTLRRLLPVGHLNARRVGTRRRLVFRYQRPWRRSPSFNYPSGSQTRLHEVVNAIAGAPSLFCIPIPVRLKRG